MKDVKIQTLYLKNFKGIKDFAIDFGGKDVNIYGRNATGKTTIVDAFMWLFFNKDSSGASDFDIKTKTEDGEYIHNLEHSVEALIEHDGTQTIFKKVYKEKYTKQRGSVTERFTGHTTDYYIDAVPKKKKEYEAIVNELFDSRYFQMITDPLYFNQKMKWQERRALLIDLCDGVKDEDVINLNDDLEELLFAKGNKTIDEYRLYLKSQMKPINEELKAIPIKINEARLAIPDDLEEFNQDQLDFINQKIKELESKKVTMMNGGALAEKEMELIKLRNAKLMLEQEVPSTKALRDKAMELEYQKANLKYKIKEYESDIEFKNKRVNANVIERENLRNHYNDILDSQYDENNNICPTCGQELPDEQIQGFIEKFNIDKSNTLEEINVKGMNLKREFDEITNEVLSMQSAIQASEKELENIQKEIDLNHQKISNIQKDFKIEQQIKIDKVDEKIVACEREIDYLKSNMSSSTVPIDEEIVELKEQRSEIESIKAKIHVAEAQNKRIADLEAKETELAHTYNRMDQMLYLTDLFIKEKVKLLTKRINSHFKLCKFKLFDEQINGGVNECCEVTVDGVSYNDLNNAMKINAGLDCINMICVFSNVYAPIFIDNAEAVNEVLETVSQQVRLYVSEDKHLRIEREGE